MCAVSGIDALVGVALNTANPYTSYDDIYIYHLLERVENHTPYHHFLHFGIQQLIEYDSLHATDYYHTLYIYLTSNKDVPTCTEKLFIHRNILFYRILPSRRTAKHARLTSIPK